MTKTLRLTVTTPDRVLVDTGDVVSLRAEDESGGFGILPGHTDLLTVLTPSVLRWRDAAGAMRYCAVHGGVMTVTGGERVAIACRQGDPGDDLATLETTIRERRGAETDAERRTRVEQMRLHALAVRRLVGALAPHGVPSVPTPDGTSLVEGGGAP